jgi:hypothetical protein
MSENPAVEFNGDRLIVAAARTDLHHQFPHMASMLIAAPFTRVASQPSHFSAGGMANLPITLRRKRGAKVNQSDCGRYINGIPIYLHQTEALTMMVQ